MNTLDDSRGTNPPRVAGRARTSDRSKGQIAVLFVLAIFIFTGMVALVIDVSWYWVNALRVQRAADAAALAGVVQLPTNPTAPGTGAYALARAEAKKNGYDDALASVVLTPVQEPAVTGRRLNVTLSAPVDMFFMRIFGINQINVTRTARAEFVLPVPMGSPDNWYGVFGMTRDLTETTTTTTTTPGFYSPSGSRDSGLLGPNSANAPATPGWTTSNAGTMLAAVQNNDNVYARTTLNNATQIWGNFRLLDGLPAGQIATDLTGLQVVLSDVFVSASCTNTTLRVALSYDGGVHWTSDVNTALPAGNRTATLNTTNTRDFTMGSTTSLVAWPLASPTHTWSGDDLDNGNFVLRLTAAKGCATATTQINVDQIQVRAIYDKSTWNPPVTTTTTTTSNVADKLLQGPGAACTTGVADCYEATGQNLSPNGFWGTMNSEGAESINGDAYSAYYDTFGGTTNPEYGPVEFYNYAVEMPPGSSGGSVYVYDPNFCTTRVDSGTGDRWFNPSGPGDNINSVYELFDTKGTLDDLTDDGAAVATSGSLFTGGNASDTSMGGRSGAPDCRYKTDVPYGDDRDYHDRWYRLASGLAGGKIYRIHTTSTDPANIGQTRGTYGENSFALYASAAVGTPRIYGIGAMQAFTPLSASGSEVSSEFYLAQIEAVHAGKTVEIKLWDPGDTSPLSGTLEILAPNSSGWAPTRFDYTAAEGTTNGNATNCGTFAGNDVSSVQTSTPASRFNGCWLTIQIPIPSSYVADQDGWWKIRYKMTGNGTSVDVTTWTVQILGNPVHLIVP